MSRQTLQPDPLTSAVYAGFRDVFAILDTEGAGQISTAELQRPEAEKLRARLRALFGEAGLFSAGLSENAATDTRTGLSPEALLRTLLPTVPPTTFHQRVGEFEDLWRQSNSDGGEKLRKEFDSDVEDENGRDVALRAWPNRVVNMDVFLFIKEIFQNIDVQGAGKISLRELRLLLDTCGTFWQGLHWKLIVSRGSALRRRRARDVDTWVTFDGVLRVVYQTVPAWRLRRDGAALAAQYCLPRGVRGWEPWMQQPCMLPPKVAPLTFEINGGCRPTLRVLRAACTELAFDESEQRDSLIQSELARRRILRARLQGRRVMIGRDVQDCVERLYDREVKKAETRKKVREQTLSKRPESPWFSRRKLTEEDMEMANFRLYVEPADRKYAREEERETELASMSLVSSAEPLEPEQADAMIERLGVADIAARKERTSKREAEALHVPRKTRLTAAAQAAMAMRLTAHRSKLLAN
eukprot:Hpha_TRINITY_DN6395_c0_g1::TRINITY_DN6395_c0_g1_i1::g.145556::m.145556